MQTLRADSALPASGAYDTDPASVALPPSKATARLTLACRYTLSTAAGVTGAGFARLHPEWKVDGHWVPDPAVLSTSVVSGYQRGVLGGVELSLPNPPSTTVDFAVPFTVLDGASDFRCGAAEAGDTAHPGSLETSVAFGVR